MRIGLAIAALAVLVPSASAVSAGTIARGSLQVDGLTRTYRLYVPAKVKKPTPVVLVFHGAGGTGEAIARSSAFDAQGAREGFLVVYPDGFARTWNAGRCCGPAQRLGVNDVRFIARLLDRLGSEYRLDRKRVYTTGLSNGGMFSYALACALSGRIAAAAPVAATLVTDCAPSRSVSILHVHGLDDPRVPFTGGVGSGRAGIDWPPVQRGIDRWRGLNACPATGTVVTQGTATTSEWSPCMNGTAVRLVTLAGVGHMWPREPYDATRQIWRFFAAHPRR